MKPSTAKEMRELANNSQHRAEAIIGRKADSLYQYAMSKIYCEAKQGKFDCEFSYVVIHDTLGKAKISYPEMDFSGGTDYVIVDEYFGDNNLSDSNTGFIQMTIDKLKKDGYCIYQIYSSTQFYNNLYVVHISW